MERTFTLTIGGPIDDKQLPQLLEIIESFTPDLLHERDLGVAIQMAASSGQVARFHYDGKYADDAVSQLAALGIAFDLVDEGDIEVEPLLVYSRDGSLNERPCTKDGEVLVPYEEALALLTNSGNSRDRFEEAYGVEPLKPITLTTAATS